MQAGYHRRSRQGCLTCRAARIKCDETHPTCLECRRRGVTCGGYSQRLKWVTDVDTGTQTAQCTPETRETGVSRHRRHQSHPNDAWRVENAPKRNPKTGPALRSADDVAIFVHWAQMLPELVYPNPDRYRNIADRYLSFVWDPESVLLPAILASGAAHLAALGVMSQIKVLERKQTALHTLLRALRLTMTLQYIPAHFHDSTISASMAIAGLEVTQGSGHGPVVTVLKGIKSQIELRSGRQIAQPGNPLRASQIHDGSELLVSNIKMMAYFDVMCCVPCARRPVADRAFWDSYVLCYCDGVDDLQREPDVVLGYCTKIFPFLGEAAALVESFFDGSTSPDDFSATSRRLLESLRDCCEELPLAILQPFPDDLFTSLSSRSINTANACIAAAQAHSLATQIFLQRAGDGGRVSNASLLRDELFDAVTRVSLDTSAATMMIWPMFVLGCEAAAGSALRHEIAVRFEQMIEKQKILNINVAFETLQQRIWTLSASSGAINGQTDFTQSQWVRYCWQEKIELCLA